MDTKIIGIDPSINSTGLCVYNPVTNSTTYYIVAPKVTKKQASFETPHLKYLIYNKHETKGLDYSDKENAKTHNIFDICSKIMQVCQVFNITHAIMEGISYGSAVGSAALADLAGLNFAIRMFLNQAGIKITIVAPTELKKFAVANGGASKEQMVDAWLRIDTKMTQEHIKKNDDLADAFFLARYGLNL